LQDIKIQLPLDYLGRPINVGDYVFYYSNLYEVLSTGRVLPNGNSTVRIILVDKSKTTTSVRKFSREMCIVDKEEVFIWKLKKTT
jgi:hypothetical protein